MVKNLRMEFLEMTRHFVATVRCRYLEPLKRGDAERQTSAEEMRPFVHRH